jgi:hypothetical protein
MVSSPDGGNTAAGGLLHSAYWLLAVVTFRRTTAHISTRRVAIGIFRGDNRCVVIDNTDLGVAQMTLIEDDSGREIAAVQPDGRWRTSTRCVPNGNCAEIDRGRSDRVGVRDSKHPVAALAFQPPAWRQFLEYSRMSPVGDQGGSHSAKDQ